MVERISHLDLKVVAAVAETGSFRKSGVLLGLGQPAVSRRVARVEDLIGVSLFERRRSGARLTAAGRIFVGHARPVLDDLTAAVAAARIAGEGASGELTIGLIASLSRGALRRLIEDFVRDHARVLLGFVEAERSELLSLLTHREIDVVLAAGTGVLDICDTLLLDEEAVYLAVPSTSPYAQKERIRWSQAINETFLLSARDPGPEIHDYILRRISDLGKPVNVQRHRLGREGIMTLVGLGLGVSVVADHWRGVSYPNVTFVPVGDPGELVPFSLVWRPENDNPALRRFLSLARIEAKRNGALS
jgi:DNA-binding transcriptional LysR family regulator